MNQPVAVAHSIVRTIKQNADIGPGAAQGKAFDGAAHLGVVGERIQRGNPQPEAAAAGADQRGQRVAGVVTVRVVQGVVVANDQLHGLDQRLEHLPVGDVGIHENAAGDGEACSFIEAGGVGLGVQEDLFHAIGPGGFFSGDQ